MTRSPRLVSVQAGLLALACALGGFAGDADALRSLAPQDGPVDGPVCRYCKSVGTEECGEHGRLDLSHESEVGFCSFVADCAACNGLGLVSCRHCDNEAADAVLAERARQLERHREELAVFDGEMGRALRKGATPHVNLVWEIDSLKVGKKRFDDHALLHLYLERLEALYAAYVEVLHARPGDIKKRMDVLVWWLPGDQLKSSLKFAGNTSAYGVKLMGASMVYSVCGNKQQFRGDEQLHRSIVHNATHLLLAHEEPSLWLGNLRGGWAEEGLAHFMEFRFFGVCDNYCYEEQNTNRDFKGGNFKPAFRKMVAMDDAPSMAGLISKNTTELTLPEHAACFSLVDYLIHLDGAKFGRVCARLRDREEARDALQAEYDTPVLTLEKDWHAWVLETYPAR